MPASDSVRGWGLGDIDGAIEACLALPDGEVIAIAGRNAAPHSTLRCRHGYDPRVSVLGYTTQMRDLLSAPDAFVTTTAGGSLQEARACGCRAVCYGFLIGPVRDNVNAAAGHGVARADTSRDELRRELRVALHEGRRTIPSYKGWPTDAELTVAPARGQVGRSPAAARPAESHEMARSGG